MDVKENFQQQIGFDHALPVPDILSVFFSTEGKILFLVSSLQNHMAGFCPISSECFNRFLNVYSYIKMQNKSVLFDIGVPKLGGWGSAAWEFSPLCTVFFFVKASLIKNNLSPWNLSPPSWQIWSARRPPTWSLTSSWKETLPQAKRQKLSLLNFQQYTTFINRQFS